MTKVCSGCGKALNSGNTSARDSDICLVCWHNEFTKRMRLRSAERSATEARAGRVSVMGTSQTSQQPALDADGLLLEQGILYRNNLIPSVWYLEHVGHREVTLRLLWCIPGYEHVLKKFGALLQHHDVEPNVYHTLPANMKSFSRFDPAWLGQVFQDIARFLQEQYGTK